MSALIFAVATFFPCGEGCRHQLGVDERILGLPDPEGGCMLLGANERTLGLPDPGGGYRHRLGQDERTLDLPDPGGGCRHPSYCLSQESLSTQFL